MNEYIIKLETQLIAYQQKHLLYIQTKRGKKLIKKVQQRIVEIQSELDTAQKLYDIIQKHKQKYLLLD